MNAGRAFTLIELLVVIAIIAILAAITFPAIVESKKRAMKDSDMSNMNQIRTALQLYRADQGAYPPALLGYATGYSNLTPADADIIPADKAFGPLYPKRVDALSTFRSNGQDAATNSTSFTKAVWPNAFAEDADPLRNQKYGPADGFVSRCDLDVSDGNRKAFDNFYYKTSGYDVAEVKAGGVKRTELRYTLFWSGYGVASDPCKPLPNDGAGSSNDDPRQLGYTDPPESTVVTWNSFYRQFDGSGNPLRAKLDYVLFLGGNVRPMDSANVAQQSWKLHP